MINVFVLVQLLMETIGFFQTCGRLANLFLRN
jgi:hypothetical protein